MSASPVPAAEGSLSDKQHQILTYLRDRGRSKTYFKSRLIARELGLTAKEVGTNMVALRDGDFDVDIDEWGYSSSTTWEVSIDEGAAVAPNE